MHDDEIADLLQAGLREAVRLLVARVREGEASAADIGKLREFAREAGVALQVHGTTTPLGDEILESMADIDPDMLN